VSADPASLTLAGAARALRARTLSPVDLLDTCLEHVRRCNPVLDAFVLLTEERARADAERAHREIASGQWRGPLHGVPYGLKDIIDTEGIRTTCHSRLLIDNVPTQDAHVAALLRQAGGVLLGKMATHEFATGGPAFDLPFPPARNPWDRACFTGGSSSGSGAAVASGMLPLALGTDTGGSIRLPAAYCGVAGIKPTYGRVSRRGVAPLSFSLDHIGPLCWTVEDCALSLGVLAGFDAADPGSADVAVPDYAAALEGGVAGLTIGYVRKFGDGASDDMASGIETALAELSRLGARIVEVELPDMSLFQAAYRAICGAEGFAVHAHDLRTRPHLYARVTRERLMVGAFVTGDDYVQGQRMRRELTSAVDRALDGVDLLASAAILAPAPRLEDVDISPLRRAAPITVPFNITGHPALSLCCGYGRSGLPLALQLIGRPFDEARVLRAGHTYESATHWREQRPTIIPQAVAAQ
jgi:aspartyl-tRNA(Asn)/glutamyl-tRNA(Gln) amidotransferase subunit A